MVPSVVAGKAVVREMPGAAGVVIGSSRQRNILCRAGGSVESSVHVVTAHQGQDVTAGKSYHRAPKMEL